MKDVTKTIDTIAKAQSNLQIWINAIKRQGILNATLVYNLEKALNYFMDALVNGKDIEVQIKKKWDDNIGLVSRYFEGDEEFIDNIYEVDKLLFGDRY